MANVLVVDDQEDLIILVKLCLIAKGHKVAGAFNRESMYKKLESFKPDLIILDVMLGQEDGRLICKELKEAGYKDIPIVLYSALQEMLSNFRLFNAECTLQKPFDVTALQEKVEKVLTGNYD